MKYQIIQGTVSFGDRVILNHINFEVRDGEKIAVTGRNGAGKTTLLRLIAGEIQPDRDDKQSGPIIQASRSITIGMLRQTMEEADQDKRAGAYLLEKFRGNEKYSRERFAFESECDRLLTGLGFLLEDKKKCLRDFSGGQQTKLRLIRLLLEKPELLLLDEPTNHLDVTAAEWLEQYLRSYPNAVVYVSHDRYFLDQVADICYDLDQGVLTRYAGNYTESRRQKLKNIQLAQKAYEKQQEEIRHLEELIRTFKNKPKKASFARSRKTMLDRMERLQPPTADEAHLFPGPIEPLEPGSKWVIDADHLKIGYDGRALLELTLRIRKGQKIGIIGPNGIGKTTFLKTLAGLLEPVKGSFTLGNHISFGYFDQQTAEITSDKTVADHFRELYPALLEKEARQILGHYLFGGRKAQALVSQLSGGEKSRLVLCELLQAGPNLMLLDEPTNHMDIPARETLESAFGAYTGTILFISHDRYFIRQVADAILEFDADGVTYYPFGYENYKKKSKEKGLLPSSIISAENMSLMEGFRSVARAERHESRPLTSEEAYVDWRLRLADEEFFAEAEECLAFFEEAERDRRERELLCMERALADYENWIRAASVEEMNDNRLELTNQTDYREQFAQINQTDRAEQLEQRIQTDRAEQLEQRIQTDQKEQADQMKQLDQRNQIEQMEQRYHEACMAWADVLFELELL